ncbi:adhesion G protein-coupled receptor B3 isoform X7 [Epinephelus fuscoguttatus]|uniref:adhesion G protein-coupled receptor B3 isoform X8 n=1 Tax=Epinephelus lanceolatus TaxID=310571 RepID=UPI001447C991|nr:adhesion G protein-coupled receptor B3 isoform X8 [Epinephelus lanceolatus]XP_049456717.1 adhesion G protein-coupled receptor B3 isoform X7 [Epinephelus fuscoguttatus]
MKAVRNLLIYIFSTYLLVMFGLTGAQDYWCSTLVKGVIYGSYSVTEMFPKNYTNCTWTLENPDPTKYSIYLKLYKRDLSCSEYSLLAYQFDHYSHEKINELLKVNESIVYLCDSKNIYVFLLYDKNFVQLRRVFPYDYNGLTPQKLEEEEKSIVEFLVLNKASPSQFGCQVLCTWLENCLKLEKGTVETCGIVYTKCTCPQHLGDGESESMLMLNNVVLPLNPQTEGCLSPQLQAGQVCNLSAEVKRPPKEGESGAEEWSQWSSCSVTCGQGSQVRTRTCVSPYGTHCSGPLRESRVCNNTAPCPVHGVWEEWSPWSLCSFTCGRGHRTRTRMCAPPQHGGRACDGPETQTKLCNIALCPVDGQWQEWSSWSDCSVTCANGTQQRTRQCSAAAHGGSECRGHWAESRECHNPDCTANGQWNPWGPWSGCSKSCDGGWQRRARVCQGAAVTGQQCDGTGEEVRKCSDQRCPAPYEICPEDYAVSMVWRRTPSGELAFNRCPPNATGTTSRRCSLDHRGMAFWEQPSYARCITNEFRYLQQSVQGHLAKGQRMLAGDGMSQVTKNLLDLTQRRNFYAGDLLSSVEILRNVTETFKRASYEPSSDDVQNFFQIISNLLEEENKEKWEDAQKIYPGAVELMQVIEEFIHIVGLGMKDFHNAYLMTGNLVASIQRLPAVSVMTDINFPMKGRKGMVDWARNSEDKVVIPKGLFVSQSADMEGSPVFILGTVLYKTLGLMLPSPKNHTVVNSKVIAVTVRPEPKATESHLEIELAHLANGTMNPYCALWDSTIMNDSWGAWSTKGCKTVLTDASHTKCLCDRVSTFAILAQQPREITMEYSGVPSVTLIVGCGLSCLSLITLAVIYAVLWRYIRSERSIILLNFCLSIICSNILILVGQTQTHNAVVCIMTTAFLHFFFLASFCWVLTEAWQSYMAVTGKVRTRLIRKRFLCLGWGLPALVVAVSMGFTKTKGYGTSLYCWLSLEGGLLYAFVGPAAAVVLVNMVIGILVFNKLVSRDGILDKKLKHRAGYDSTSLQMSEPHTGLTLKCAKCGVVSTTALSATTASNAMASLWSSCVVLPLLALTWMSAVLAMTDKRSILFQILFAVFDSLQGFVIVMVHCILRREVQDAFRCRLRNCQDPISGDATGTFPNGHAQIMTDFEKDVDIACRSALHKDMGSCRAATITGTLSRISLNDEEDEKAPEGLNYSTLPGNIISKVIIQQPSALHMPMGVGDLKEQCMADSNADMRRTVYLCTDDAMRQSDHDMVGHDMEGHAVQGQMMETDYIVMPRASAAAVSGSGNVPTLLKDDTKMNITMDTLPHERLMHYKMSPDFNISPSGMDHMNVNLEQQYPSAPEQMQNLPFEPRTAVKNFLAEMEESAGLSRSETGSTISMSSLERRKSRYSDLDFEKVMHTRKRHMELFQELNQKFQTLDRFRDIPNMGSMSSRRGCQTTNITPHWPCSQDKAMPNKNPWESYNPACEYQNYATMNVLESDTKDSLEMTPAEWEKCVNLPLDVQEGDFQTEV